MPNFGATPIPIVTDLIWPLSQVTGGAPKVTNTQSFKSTL